MIPPPPRPTLFPYTTLFRSRRAGPGLRPRPHRQGAAGEPDRVGVDELVRLRRDRKSTRLNSSHVRISYAVFCLKKKKKKRSRQRTPTIRRRSERRKPFRSDA